MTQTIRNRPRVRLLVAIGVAVACAASHAACDPWRPLAVSIVNSPDPMPVGSQMVSEIYACLMPGETLGSLTFRIFNDRAGTTIALDPTFGTGGIEYHPDAATFSFPLGDGSLFVSMTWNAPTCPTADDEWITIARMRWDVGGGAQGAQVRATSLVSQSRDCGGAVVQEFYDGSGNSCAMLTYCGDCNLNATVDILDALRAAQVAVGLVQLPDAGWYQCNVFGQRGGPVTAGATVDILDALEIARYDAGLYGLLTCVP